MDRYYDNEDESYSNYAGWDEKPESKKNKLLHEGDFACPNCGSKNTGSATYADYCNHCDWTQGY